MDFWALFSLLLASFGGGALAAPSERPGMAPPVPGRQVDIGGRQGAVACESSVCSAIGADLLRAGGTAADALVGTVFCVGVIGMYHSGIGGGGFLVVKSPDDQYEAIDFRETAPAAAFEEMYSKNVNLSIYGGLASAVPGEVRGMQALHDKFGRLPWKDVVMPAVNVARNGFEVTADLARYEQMAIAGIDNFLVKDAAWAQDFAPDGTLLRVGDVITRKRYANTLETIAFEGPDAFYTGRIAESTIRTLRTNGGTMTLDDLANYKVAIRTPVQTDYQGYRLTSAPPPSSGAIMLNILKTVGGYPDFGDPDKVKLSAHRIDEAMKFAYGLRTKFGDPAYLDYLYNYQNEILSDKVVNEIRSKIDDNRTFAVEYYDPQGIESLDTPGTSQISVADASGMAISITTTINLLFGSHLMDPDTGIIMNNEMNDFSIPGQSNAFGYIPMKSNFVKPGARPLSSISPLIATIPACESGKPSTLALVIGSAGGSRIITAVAQTAALLLTKTAALFDPDRADTGTDEAAIPNLHDALATPRLHDQLMPPQVSFEWTYDNSTVRYMKSLGANVTWVAPGQSTVQAVRRRRGGIFEAASEPRQRNSGANTA